MSTILKIERLLTNVRDLLINDPDIRKLLYHGGPDALEKEAPSIEDVKEKIVITNYIDRKEEDGGAGYILIFCSGWDRTEEVADISFQVSTLAWDETYLLNNGKLRNLSLLHRVFTILESKRLGFAGSLTMEGAVIQTFDNGKTLGYVSDWGVVDSDEDIR